MNVADSPVGTVVFMSDYLTKEIDDLRNHLEMIKALYTE